MGRHYFLYTGRVTPLQKSAILRAVSLLMSGQTTGMVSVPWTVPITCRQTAGNPGEMQFTSVPVAVENGGL